MTDIDLPATIARLRAFYPSLRSPRSHEQDMMHVIEQLLDERAADKARIAELKDNCISDIANAPPPSPRRQEIVEALEELDKVLPMGWSAIVREAITLIRQGAQVPAVRCNYNDIGDILYRIGWKATNDAQWTGLRDVLPELLATMLAAAPKVPG